MPELCNSYCAKECPIGRNNVHEVTIDDFDRLALKVLGSLKDIDSLRASLIAISEDGVIEENERPAFQEILNSLEKISTNAKALQLWAIKNIRLQKAPQEALRPPAALFIFLDFLFYFAACSANSVVTSSSYGTLFFRTPASSRIFCNSSKESFSKIRSSFHVFWL